MEDYREFKTNSIFFIFLTDALFLQNSTQCSSFAFIPCKNAPLFYSAAVRQGIVDSVKRALGDQKVKSVVICGQNGVFCGGTDSSISEIDTANIKLNIKF